MEVNFCVTGKVSVKYRNNCQSSCLAVEAYQQQGIMGENLDVGIKATMKISQPIVKFQKKVDLR